MPKGTSRGDRKGARQELQRGRRAAARKAPGARKAKAAKGGAGAKGGGAAGKKKLPARRAAAALPVRGDERIDRAVAFINERVRVIGAQMVAIGKYLLREFFDDDPRVVASQDPGKMNSFRALAARPDCPLSHSTLSRAVNLAIQERKLGTVASMQQLTPTHRIALLPVENPKEKRALARQAASEGWTTGELRSEIRRRAKVVPKKARVRGGGNIALAEGSLKHVAKAAKTGALSPKRVVTLPRARLARLITVMENVIDTLGRSVAAARRAVAGTDARAPARPGTASAESAS